MVIKQLVSDFLSLVFPKNCGSCHKRLEFLNDFAFCKDCKSGISYIAPPICKICGMELYAIKDHNPICSECLRKPPPYTLARSIVRYTEEVQNCIHRLKYLRDQSVTDGMVELIEQFSLSEFEKCEVIIPVPLHKKRLTWRGFNQAYLLACYTFPTRKNDIKVDWLVRKKQTVAQTSLSGVARRNNLRNSFAVTPHASFKKRTICLVDDVFTTGTTVSECSKTMLGAGAKSVAVLTLARVDVPLRGRRR